MKINCINDFTDIIDHLHISDLILTLYVVSLNPLRGEVYSIQSYVIKFVSDLRQVGDFLCVLQFPPPMKLTATI